MTVTQIHLIIFYFCYSFASFYKFTIFNGSLVKKLLSLDCLVGHFFGPAGIIVEIMMLPTHSGADDSVRLLLTKNLVRSFS